MNLHNLAHIVVRRWLLVLLGLITTSAICYGLFTTVPLNYVARTSLIMLPPSTVVQGGNPFLYLGGLGQALDVLTRKINATEVTRPILEAYPEAEFIALADGATSGPILLIEGTATSATEALAVTKAAVDAAPGELASLQTSLSVPDPARITLKPVSVDENPTVSNRNRVQAIGAAGAAGFVITLLLAAFRDGRLQARRDRDSSLSSTLATSATSHTETAVYAPALLSNTRASGSSAAAPGRTRASGTAVAPHSTPAEPARR